MGLRSKSISLPKLALTQPTEMPSKYTDGNEDDRSGQLTIKSDVCRFYSDKQLRQQQQQYAEETRSDHVTVKQSQFTTESKQRNERKTGFSRRLRVIFQSLFHLDKRGKDNFENPSQLSTQIDANFPVFENAKNRKSRSLPNLSSTLRPLRKNGSIRHQKLIISNFLRKSRRRIHSFRERNQSVTSFNRVTSNDSLQDYGHPLSKQCKSHFNSDASVPNSPLNDDYSHLFSSSVENSPILKSQSSFSSEDTASNGGTAKARRERFRRSKTTDFGKRSEKTGRFASFSESSDVAEEGDSLDLSDVILSNASAAAQCRRNVPKSKCDHVVEENLITEENEMRIHPIDEQECQQKEGGNWGEFLRQLADHELKSYLHEKDFDPQHSKSWCSDISEHIRNKINLETKGVFKIIVQVFIGAVEDDGIRTAMQCNLNPKSDEFTAVSFRNKSLFSFASLLIVDAREL